MSWWKFLKYNNAVPIILSIVLLSFGTTLAASPEIREGVSESVLSSETKVLSVDNTYLVGKDLSMFTPKVTITSVTEDVEFYYIAYSFSTIDLKDSVWRDVTREESIKVKRDALVGKDLGLYATRELKQRIDREIALLKETQEIERKQVSQKVVTTEYSGLIGKFLDDSTETLPGYSPIVDERPAQVYSDNPTPNQSVSTTSSTPSDQVEGGGAVNQSGSFTIQVLGNNPAQVDLFASYSDLGIVLTHTSNIEFGHKIYLDGAEVSQVSIDTRTPRTYVITYKTQDGAGGSAEATRTVLVGGGTPEPLPDTATPAPEPEDATSTPVL